MSLQSGLIQPNLYLGDDWYFIMSSQGEIMLFPFIPRLALAFDFHTMSSVSGRLLADFPWPTLYPTSFSHQLPKADLEGGRISSFERPQWAESTAAEQEKQANTFLCCLVTSFSKGCSSQCNCKANNSKSYYPSHIQPMKTTPKSLIPVSNSRYLSVSLWQQRQDLKFI